MKKPVALLALLLAVLFTLSGCRLIGTDAELDAKQVVLDVNGQTVTKGEFVKDWNDNVNYLAQMYQMFGQAMDPNDPNLRADTMIETRDIFVRQFVTEQKAKELGLDQFSEADEKALADEAQTSFDSTVQQYVDTYLTHTHVEGESEEVHEEDNMTPEQKTEAAKTEMAAEGFTLDTVLTGLRAQKLEQRVREHAIADVAVSEEDITTEYNTKLQAAKEAYTTNLAQYASDVSGGQDIYYVPAGYRYVKHVLVSISDADKARMSELQSALDANNATRSDLTQSVAEAVIPEDATEEEKTAIAQSKTELEAQLASVEATIATTQQELDAIKTSAFAAVKPQADEVLQKAQAGEDFDALITQYGKDPGMTTEPAKTQGYPVCAGMNTYEAAFQDAAMALPSVGSLSGLVQTAYGYHIMKYVGDSVEAETPIATLHDKIQQTLLTQKQDSTYDASMQEWIAATKVTFHENLLK